jgi:hypothetical protein
MPDGKDVLDFIVIGAQKSATTTLFHQLRQHPGVSVPDGKEWPFFSDDALYARGWEVYLESLTTSGGVGDPTRAWGTVTPQYMLGGVTNASEAPSAAPYDERTVPARIRERLPDVRLVAILRDPVARAVSHHRMVVARGGELRSFDEAVRELLRPERLQDARRRPAESSGYIAWGEYGRILSGYADVFPTGQLLVVYTDELESAPAELMRRVQGFIGVDADFVSPRLGERFLVGKGTQAFAWSSPSTWMSPSSPISPRGLGRAARGNRTARRIWHTIPFEQRVRLGRPYERVVRRVDRSQSEAAPDDVGAGTAPSAETRALLAAHYREDAERLAAITGAPPPWDRAREPG